MQDGDGVSRRSFLRKLGTGALMGLAAAASGELRGATNRQPPPGWVPPPLLKNPNILVFICDQLRQPTWLSASQIQQLGQTVLPNIVGRIQDNSYNFNQYFVAATNCTPSRSCLMTGLYTPQTAMYCTEGNQVTPIGTALNPAFPTWGGAIAALNNAYQGNCWYFGKWHLSPTMSNQPLIPYGFNTRTYPGGPVPPYNPSPDGAPNEGSDGGPFGGVVFANDAMIADDFLGWLNGQLPTPDQPQTPWCAVVSLVNPHDITKAPVWLQSNPFPPQGYPIPSVFFAPPNGIDTPPQFYTSQPDPWNYENLQQVSNKPELQYYLQTSLNKGLGTITDWTLFLNQYFLEQGYADQQVGMILNQLYSSQYANNTIVIFTADHGDYAGSHGLHDKGSAAYDESLRVPFWAQFPGQTGAIAMNQMCSEVDVFGLMCDLATQGSGQWRLTYPDLATRESMWSYLYNNSSETRIAPAPVSVPYIFHTYDEVQPGSYTPPKAHLVCLRTKLDPANGYYGGKLVYYWAWDECTTYPNSIPPDAEFYDYDPSTTNNTSEMGNDYYDPVCQTKLAQYTQAMGTLGPVPTGLIACELNRPLVGTGTDGNPLTAAQATAQQTFYNYAYGIGACSLPNKSR